MIDLDQLLNSRTHTGKRGRPAGSGKPDTNTLYRVSRLLAANPSMTVAAAVRTWSPSLRRASRRHVDLRRPTRRWDQSRELIGPLEPRLRLLRSFDSSNLFLGHF